MYKYIPQTKTARQVRGSYMFSKVIPLNSKIAGCQVPKPRCLSPAAHSLNSRIAGDRVPKPRCLSPKTILFFSGAPRERMFRFPFEVAQQ